MEISNRLREIRAVEIDIKMISALNTSVNAVFR